jgi:hypothetical protein
LAHAQRCSRSFCSTELIPRHRLSTHAEQPLDEVESTSKKGDGVAGDGGA